MNKGKIGIALMLLGLILVGLGIGLKAKNPEMNTSLYTTSGLVLNSLGLFLGFASKKKGEE